MDGWMDGWMDGGREGGREGYFVRSLLSNQQQISLPGDAEGKSDAQVHVSFTFAVFDMDID